MPEATQHTNQSPNAAAAAGPAATAATPAPLRSVVVLDAPSGGWGISLSCESPTPQPRRQRSATHTAAPPAESSPESNSAPPTAANEVKQQNGTPVAEGVGSPDATAKVRARAATAPRSNEPARFRMRREEAFPGWGEPAPSYRYFGEDVQRRFRAMKAAAGGSSPDESTEGSDVEAAESVHPEAE